MASLRRTWFLGLILTVLLAACSAQVNVTGTWTGTAADPDVFDITLVLSQSGNTVTGSLDGTFPVSGSLNGNALALSVDGPELMTFVGQVDGNTISGTFVVSDAGGAVVGSGTFSVTRD